MKNFIKATIAASALALSMSASATVIHSGYTFEDNAFADVVVSYSQGAGVGANYDNPNDALGEPDYSSPTGSVSLGRGGSLVLQFTDNSLTTSGNSDADLYVFEIGGAIEYFDVDISTNGVDWINVGTSIGQPAVIDIDAVAGVVLYELYSFVRLTDVDPDQSGSPFAEADIDAVGAISSAPPASVPAPASIGLVLLGLAMLRSARKRNC